MSDLVTRLRVISELNLSEGPDVNGALLDEARTEILRLRSLVAATQEKCAQVAHDELLNAANDEAADDARGYSANVHHNRGRMKSAETIYDAIRALKMETGHE